MEINVTHETVRVSETVLDRTLEQTIELEYNLPDYYPNIFKMLKCRMTPHIYACRTSGDKLVADGVAVIYMLYVDEENQIHSIVQKINFSKTVDLNSEVQSPNISCFATADYVNCRVLNPGKIDLRGAITVKLHIASQRDETVLAAADGEGVQLKQTSLLSSSEQICENRQFGISEQIDLEGYPPVGELLTVEMTAVPDSCKLIANKAITKGIAHLRIVYRTADEPARIQTVDSEIPISQILDMPGVDEDYLCDVKFDVGATETSEAEGGLIIEADITVFCRAFLPRELNLITDAFSTLYNLSPTVKRIRIMGKRETFHQKLVLSRELDLPQLREVYNSCAEISDLNGTLSNDIIEFTASLNLILFGLNENGDPVADERNVPITFKIPQRYCCEKAVIEAEAIPISTDCTVNGNTADLKITVFLCGSIMCFEEIDVLTDITVNEDMPKEIPSDAVTLYYPESGEDIWDIAKRFSTSVEAITKENNLKQSDTSDAKMLIIPFVK